MDKLKKGYYWLSIYNLRYYKTVFKIKRCKQMEVYPNHNFGQNAGPMPEKYQDKRINPRVEVTTWEV